MEAENEPEIYVNVRQEDSNVNDDEPREEREQGKIERMWIKQDKTIK